NPHSAPGKTRRNFLSAAVGISEELRKVTSGIQPQSHPKQRVGRRKVLLRRHRPHQFDSMAVNLEYAGHPVGEDAVLFAVPDRPATLLLGACFSHHDGAYLAINECETESITHIEFQGSQRVLGSAFDVHSSLSPKTLTGAPLIRPLLRSCAEVLTPSRHVRP